MADKSRDHKKAESLVSLSISDVLVAIDQADRGTYMLASSCNLFPLRPLVLIL